MSEVTVFQDAETRREAILVAASTAFARAGYAATPVTAVAEAAGISQAYVFKLFPTKLELFVAVVVRSYEQVAEKLNAAADKAGHAKSDKVLDAMSRAYEQLLTDPDILLLQVHAQAATDVPEIEDAVRHGVARVIAVVKARSDAKKQKIQRFIAHCQLCHLVATLDVEGSEETWARTLTAGLKPRK